MRELVLVSSGLSSRPYNQGQAICSVCGHGAEWMAWLASLPPLVKLRTQGVSKTHNQISGELQSIILRDCKRSPEADSCCVRSGSQAGSPPPWGGGWNQASGLLWFSPCYVSPHPHATLLALQGTQLFWNLTSSPFPGPSLGWGRRGAHSAKRKAALILWGTAILCPRCLSCLTLLPAVLPPRPHFQHHYQPGSSSSGNINRGITVTSF